MATLLQTKLVFLYTFISEEAPQFGQYKPHVFFFPLFFVTFLFSDGRTAPPNAAFCRISNFRLWWCDSLNNNAYCLYLEISIY